MDDLLVAVIEPPPEEPDTRQGHPREVTADCVGRRAEDVPRSVRAVVRHDDEDVAEDVQRSHRAVAHDDEFPFGNRRGEAHRESRPDRLVLEGRDDVANLRCGGTCVDRPWLESPTEHATQQVEKVGGLVEEEPAR